MSPLRGFLSAEENACWMSSEDRPQFRSETDAPQGTAARKPPPTFADVARRTTSRTSDLIAIAIVVVASLTLGRQVLRWWQAEAPSPDAAAEAGPAPAYEIGNAPLLLEFGDIPLAMTRQAIRGDEETAVDALVARCWEEAQRVGTARLPEEESRLKAELQRLPDHEPDQAEKRLLDRIAGLEPVIEEPGVCRLYVIDERFPMVAAVGPVGVAEAVRLRPARNEDPPNSDEFGHERAAAAPLHPAGSVPRLLCWGMALPLGNSAWTLYIFRQSPAKNRPDSDFLDVPLPPGAKRNLSLRDVHGGGLIGFSTSAPANTLIRFYDNWFKSHGWLQAEDWQTGQGVWTARFRSSASAAAAQADVRFAEDKGGVLMGILQIVPPDSARDSSAEKRGRE